jgi:hypothetical protein
LPVSIWKVAILKRPIHGWRKFLRMRPIKSMNEISCWRKYTKNKGIPKNWRNSFTRNSEPIIPRIPYRRFWI